MAKKPLFDLDAFRSQPLPSEEEIMSGWRGDVSKPVVSVLCNTYNHKPYIEDALRGFLIQKTDFPFEVVVHDDASTDGTTNILQEYGKRYPSIIKLVTQSENQYSKGFKPTYLALPHSSGQFIAMCEGDDFWINPEKLAIQLSILEKRKEASIVVHDAYFMSPKVIKIFSVPVKGFYFTESDILRCEGQFAPTSSYFFRRGVLDLVPDWKKYAPVGDFLIEMYSQILGSGIYIDMVGSLYRFQASGSWSGGIAGDPEKRLHFIYKNIKTLYLLLNDFPDSQYLIYKRISILKHRIFQHAIITELDDDLTNLFCEFSFGRYRIYEWGVKGLGLKAMKKYLAFHVIARRVILKLKVW